MIRIVSAGETLNEYKAGDVDFVDVQDMLPAPEDVTATLDSGSIIVNWSSLENAVYKVYRSSDNYNFKEISGDVTIGEYTDRNPLKGINYYKIRAVVDGVESAASPSVSVLNADGNHVKGGYMGFNGLCSFGENETKISKCILKFKIYDRDEPCHYKILGIGADGGKAVFSYLNLLTGEKYEFCDENMEISGVRSYKFTRSGHELLVTIDWDKYKELFPADYYHASADEEILEDNYLTVVSDYGKAKIEDTEDELRNIQSTLGVMLGNMEEKHLAPFPRTSAVEYFKNNYVVNNTPFERDGILKTITIGRYDSSPTDSDDFILYIGKIDQRGFLINPRKYTYPLREVALSSSDSGPDLTINLKDKGVKVNQGEVMCFYSGEYNGDSDKSILIGRGTAESGKVLTASDILGTFTPTNNFAHLEYDVCYYDAGFASKEEMETISDHISTMTSLLNSANLLKDDVTGETYRLIVSNGQLFLKNTNYKKALFIGSSFITHPVSESVGWYYNGAMAPSIAEHSLPMLVLRGLKERDKDCSLNIASSINWERNYNNSYDFDKDLKPVLENANPDVIFMHISGNSTWTEDFKSACDIFIKDVKRTCPLADIVIAASWHGGQKASDFRAACVDNGVSYVDLTPYKISKNMWRAGDYYISGDSGEYYPIYESVRWHPNDMGCLRQANAYLSAAGYDELQIVHDVKLATSGAGRASIPDSEWVEDGVVTVRIESGTPAGIVVTTASGEPVETALRTNEQNPDYSTYYTFIMPHEDVKVEIEFK
ncbi:MAG: hypothetical protein K2J15_00170 [Muribaculaceae bacterium]|nr:hypothetical protein [Muribaculaceae bacterium]